MLIKRLFDITVALIVLLVFSPLLIGVALAIWIYDFHSPLYRPKRVGRGGAMFTMAKFRSMVANADKMGGSSTAGDDRRITPVGRFVRKCKIDELCQFWNVLLGDMSVVGPRPQVKIDADLYTPEEQRMLTVRPGITDPASIVFSDEGDILHGSSNPDLLYNQIIRPWKSRLALLYIDNRNLFVDVHLIWLTALAIVSKRAALNGLQTLLVSWRADPLIIQMAARADTLRPYPPPGASSVVATYP